MRSYKYMSNYFAKGRKIILFEATGVCISFFGIFMLKNMKFLKEIIFLIQNIGHRFLYILPTFPVIMYTEYHARKTACLLRQTIRRASFWHFRDFELLCERVLHWCEEVIIRWRQDRWVRQMRKNVPLKRFQGAFHWFCWVRRCIVVQQNHFAMSFVPFWWSFNSQFSIRC